MFATIYTDISGNQKDGFAYAFRIKTDSGSITDTGFLESNCHDNNMAEMKAINLAIAKAIQHFSNLSRILVVTDSKTAQDVLWHGTSHEKYKYLVTEFRSLEKKIDKILIKWTKGHKDDQSTRTWCNNWCDQTSRNTFSRQQKLLVRTNLNLWRWFS